MTDQQKIEITKAFAYGETPEQAAAAESIGVSTARDIQQSSTAEITEEREMLKKVGYV
jgi:hypothetical protein